MEDKSYLDRKYFINREFYNCPYCNRNNLPYTLIKKIKFDWKSYEECFVYFVECSYCKRVSMHLSYEDIAKPVVNQPGGSALYYNFHDVDDIDSKIFYSVPTSFFVIDSRIPAIIRELITEAEGCLKMNFLTGASACMRKAIYEFTLKEKAEGKDYESKIKFLKSKYQSVDSVLFDVLAAIKDMTSDKIHEQSWDEWDSNNLKLIIEALKTILYEIYVLPRKKEEKKKEILQLREKDQKKKSKSS